MQRKIGNEAELGATVWPFHRVGGSSVIDRTVSNYEDSGEKVEKIRQLIPTETYDADIASYIPGTLDLVYQEMIEDIYTKEKTAHISYKELKQLDFQIMLTDKNYVNPNSIRLCFPMKIKNTAMSQTT